MKLPRSWKSLWSADYIWESDDHPIMKGVKTLFYAITFILLGCWLVPLRNKLRKMRLTPLVWACNNVPNAITVLLRGVGGVISVPLLVLTIWHAESASPFKFWLTGVGWFWVIALLFCTDFLDGPLARMLDYVTVFGKEADPIVDKLISALLAIGMVALVFRMQGIPVAVVLAGVTAWIFWIEAGITIITMRARRISRLTGKKMHGAFGPGKVKFVLQSASLCFGYSWLIWSSNSPVGTILAIGLFMLAWPFADKSRALHYAELLKLRDLCYSNVVPISADEEAA